MTYAEFIRWLEGRGWVFVRANGKHLVYQAPNGARMPVSKSPAKTAPQNAKANAMRKERGTP